ncbi:MAG: GDP-mannose 4,6-dehydratase [Candidatus Omnitrophica bacterium]|nr:GDP-mannose 4,6-dehydratase [Candidatus Omnitrophota bacterium]
MKVSVKKALITGVTGQDGAYLLRFLLEKGYEVHGIRRRTSTLSTARIDDVYAGRVCPQEQVFMHYGDLHDGVSLMELVERIQPEEIYHLASQSHVQVSFENPLATVVDNVSGTISLLEAARRLNHRCRFYNAASSEMFGITPPPQNERSPFHPRSPYACSKVFTFNQTVNYREAYGLHASNGILFNHESPLRGEAFVTRKVTRAVGRIKVGLQRTLALGNLEARRDWGYAPEYVEAMWLMLQQVEPDDYVIGTGEMHSVGELCEMAFGAVGLDYRDYVVTDPTLVRPSEAHALCGDASKAAATLGWHPRTTFQRLVEIMVEADLELAAEEKKLGRLISSY